MGGKWTREFPQESLILPGKRGPETELFSNPWRLWLAPSKNSFGACVPVVKNEVQEDVPGNEKSGPLLLKRPAEFGWLSLCRPTKRRYIMPPMPPMPWSWWSPPAGAGGSGMSVMRHSVVSSRPLMEAAFCSALRVTLVGSTTPALTRST